MYYRLYYRLLNVAVSFAFGVGLEEMGAERILRCSVAFSGKRRNSEWMRIVLSIL